MERFGTAQNNYRHSQLAEQILVWHRCEDTLTVSPLSNNAL